MLFAVVVVHFPIFFKLHIFKVSEKFKEMIMQSMLMFATLAEFPCAFYILVFDFGFLLCLTVVLSTIPSYRA